MDKTNLKVIEGNLLLNPEDSCGEFISAEVTDTRLMGVMGLHVSRKRNESSFHQFFYIDTEEYGLDDYQSFLDMTPIDASKKKSELFGALGGNWTNINEKEALFLIRHYSKINIKQNLPLPEGIDEYGPILSTDFTMKSTEKTALWEKICIKPRNDYELINYYIMRMVGMDSESILRFTSPASIIRKLKITNPGSLLKNEISKASDSNSSPMHTYTCVSLIDLDKDYQLVESEVSVLDGKITRFVAGEQMSISPWEASLILNNPEYIIHARIVDYPNNIEASDWRVTFRESVRSLFGTVTESTYDFGSLFMIFRKNNDHVRRKLYRLDHDTIGVICLLESGEIVISAIDPIQIERVFRSLIADLELMKFKVEERGRYKFPEPMLVRFIDSDFETFEDFLEYINSFSAD